MKYRRILIFLLALGFALASCGGGLTPEAKLNRIHFLTTHGKHDEALKFAKEAYVEEEGEARGQILLAGAALAYQKYNTTLQKSYLNEMFSLLNVVINEKLSGASDAYLMASQAHGQLGHVDKAVDFARRGASVARDKQTAGKCYLELVKLYLDKKEYAKVIKECDNLLSKIPEYQGKEQIEGYRQYAKKTLEQLQRGGGGE